MRRGRKKTDNEDCEGLDLDACSSHRRTLGKERDHAQSTAALISSLEQSLPEILKCN